MAGSEREWRRRREGKAGGIQDAVAVALAKLVHAPLSCQSPTDPPGIELYVHHLAVYRRPLYTTCWPPLYYREQHQAVSARV